MDFKDTIRQLGERVVRLKDHTQTEEATKHAFILPFIQALGYDYSNPQEVVPEFITDVGTRRGEKVDFVVMRDACPALLIEVKHWREKLDNHDGQLLRYFHVCKAKFSILTNGVTYRFFTDLVDTNKMDAHPFLEFDITTVSDNQIEEVKQFHKSYFNESTIAARASELKYTAAIKSLLLGELKTPSEGFVKYFAGQVYKGRITDKVVHHFTELMRGCIQQTLNDMVNDRLKAAIAQEQAEAEKTAEPAQEATEETGPKIVTTPEETEAYYIIKSILRRKLDPDRIHLRDSQTYCAIILDDNNRKPICRLHFNGTKKQVGIFDAARREVRHEIKDLDGIYNLTDTLRATVDTYLGLAS